MTAEEYIKLKRQEDYPGGHLCYRLSEEDALKAVDMARSEKTDQGISRQQGWICPKCGRVYSPYTSMCSSCNNMDFSDLKKLSDGELSMPARVTYPIDKRFNK